MRRGIGEGAQPWQVSRSPRRETYASRIAREREDEQRLLDALKTVALAFAMASVMVLLMKMEGGI